MFLKVLFVFAVAVGVLGQGGDQGRDQGKDQGKDQGRDQGKDQGRGQGRDQGLGNDRNQNRDQGIGTTVLPPWQDLGITQPINEVEIKFRGPKIEQGKELTKDETNEKPKLKLLGGCDDKSSFAVTMLDVDAPTKQDPFMKEWIHWLDVNDKCSQLGQGRDIIEYKAPDPSVGSGEHRYVIVVMKRGQDFKDNEINELSKLDRSNFKLSDFLTKYNLELVAGSYFVVKG